MISYVLIITLTLQIFLIKKLHVIYFNIKFTNYLELNYNLMNNET